MSHTVVCSSGTLLHSTLFPQPHLLSVSAMASVCAKRLRPSMRLGTCHEQESLAHEAPDEHEPARGVEPAGQLGGGE